MRSQNIPCHLIFPTSEDNLISIKKFSGGKKYSVEGERRTVNRPRAETSGHCSMALYFRRRQGRREGFRRESSRGCRQNGPRIVQIFAPLPLTTQVYSILPQVGRHQAINSGACWGYIRQFVRGSITASKCDNFSLAEIRVQPLQICLVTVAAGPQV